VEAPKRLRTTSQKLLPLSPHIGQGHPRRMLLEAILLLTFASIVCSLPRLSPLVWEKKETSCCQTRPMPSYDERTCHVFGVTSLPRIKDRRFCGPARRNIIRLRQPFGGWRSPPFPVDLAQRGKRQVRPGTPTDVQVGTRVQEYV
jgi:hypothetical protein